MPQKSKDVRIFEFAIEVLFSTRRFAIGLLVNVDKVPHRTDSVAVDCLHLPSGSCIGEEGLF